MAEREQKQRQTEERRGESSEEMAPADSETTDKLKADLDDLLDEID